MLELAREGAYELCLSAFILAELHGVLTRKFGWEQTRSRRAIALIGAASTIVESSSTVSVITRNDADNRILECAVASDADYLVTGDRRDLLPLREYERVKIVTSATFLSVMFEGDSTQ